MDVLFDLASVTKPMTALAFARPGVDRQTPLGDLLAEARGTPSEGCLSSLPVPPGRAGCPPQALRAPPPGPGGRWTSQPSRGGDARRVDAPGAAPPGGFAPLYSDLGYVLAGAALARTVGAGTPGGHRAARARALGLGSSAGTVVTSPPAASPARSPRPRRSLAGRPVGAVHDENAWALDRRRLGPRGHFATLGAVLTFGRGGARLAGARRRARVARPSRVPAARSARASTARARHPSRRARASVRGRAPSGTSASPGRASGSIRTRASSCPSSRTASVPRGTTWPSAVRAHGRTTPSSRGRPAEPPQNIMRRA